MNQPYPYRAAKAPRTAALLLAAAALWALPTGAQTQVVTNTNDTGAGSLRQAVLEAGAGAGGVVTFDAALNNGTIALTSQILLDQAITLNAAGQGITISGGGSTRIFFVDAAGTTTLNGLTLANGLAQGGNGTAGGGGGLGAGAAVFARQGSLNLVDVTLQNNQATGGANTGGGFFFGGGGGLAGVGGQGGGGNGSGGAAQLGTEPGAAPGSSSNSVGGFTNATDAGFGGGAGGGGAVLEGSPGGGGNGGNAGFGGGGASGGVIGDTGNSGNGGNAGFGGGAGAGGSFVGAANEFSGAGSGGDAGFGGGAGAAGTPLLGISAGGAGGAAGLGGGAAGPFNGGGGAGLGGAVFVAEGVTLSIENTATTTASGNTTTGGAGGSGGAAGASAGGLIFAQGAGQTLTFDVANNVTQALDVSGVADETALTGGINTAALTKAGLGTLTLTSNAPGSIASFGGDLTATAGRLNVNALLASNALVQAGGTLGGNGTVVNLTNTGGTVAPGNSIDTLEVTGDFTQNAAGTLEIEFDASTIDQLDITGDANLAGTVEFVELATGSAVNAAPRTFLTAENINGSFDTVTTVFATGTTLGGATLSLDTTGARDTLGVVFTEFVAAFEDQAITQTGAAAGAALDQLAASDPGASVSIINALNASAEVSSALESQGNTVANAAAFQGHSAQQLVANAARARVWGLSGRSLARQAADQQAAAQQAADTAWFTIAQGLEPELTSDAHEAPAQLATELPAPAADHNAPSFWAQAVGQFGDVDGDATSFGFDAATYGISLGAEWADTPRDAVAGLFIGFTESEVEIDNLNDDADIENLQFGVYGSKRINDRWSLNGSASISTLTFDTARATATGTADGEFDALGLYGAIEALYAWDRNDHRVISPFVGLEVSTIDRDGYTESGAGALNLTAQGDSDTFLTSVLGVQVAADYVLDNGWRLTPAARVGWAFQHLDDSASTTSAFSSALGNPFSTSGPDRSRSSVRLSASLDLTPSESDRWGLFARYTADLTDDAQDHIVQAGVRFTY